jgi:transcriptional regulator NrdR family protein
MADKPTGIHCIGCGKGKLATIDSRPCHGGIRRRKECNLCGWRVTTVETVIGKIRNR